MVTLRLYLPSLVLAVWAVLVAAGCNGDALQLVGLLATAAAVWVHAGESRRRVCR